MVKAGEEFVLTGLLRAFGDVYTTCMEHYSTPKAMKRMGDLFEKYKKRLKAPQATVEKEFIAVVKEVAGFELLPKQVVYTVTTRTISLQVSSLIKTELRFKQEQILQVLENRLGRDSCPKVVF